MLILLILKYKLIKIHCSIDKYGACTSCNLYKLFVQVATSTDFLYKLQLVHNINVSYSNQKTLEKSNTDPTFITLCRKTVA